MIESEETKTKSCLLNDDERGKVLDGERLPGRSA